MKPNHVADSGLKLPMGLHQNVYNIAHMLRRFDPPRAASPRLQSQCRIPPVFDRYFRREPAKMREPVSSWPISPFPVMKDRETRSFRTIRNPIAGPVLIDRAVRRPDHSRTRKVFPALRTILV